MLRNSREILKISSREIFHILYNENNDGGKSIYFHFNEDDFLAIIEVNMRELG